VLAHDEDWFYIAYVFIEYDTNATSKSKRGVRLQVSD